jgi:hypothetical protein
MRLPMDNARSSPARSATIPSMVMICQKIQSANDDSLTMYIVGTRT